MSAYELWLANDRGQRIDLLNPHEFEFSKVLGGFGYASVTLPYDKDLFNATGKDYQIHIYRAPEGGRLQLYDVYLIRNKSATDAHDHSLEMKFQGPSVAELLARRIVAFAADSVQALKTTTAADNMMKEIIRENMTLHATDARNLVDFGFIVEPDTTQGPSITKAFAWKNILTTIQQISQSSATEGTPVYFDINVSIPDAVVGTPTFEFRTYINYPGRDLRAGTSGGVVFSKQFGNVSFVHYEEDYSGEYNYIYAGGQGSGGSRAVEEVEDSDRINESIFGRRELFVNASAASTTAGIIGLANERLNDKRPRTMLRADLLDTDDTRFQTDWDMGDYVTVRAFGRQFDELIRSVSVRVNRTGHEQLSARFEHGALMGETVERIYTEYKEMAKRVDALEAEDKV